MPASQPVSANNTIVAWLSGQAVTDANHYTWSISAQGQVVANGAVDPTTANVITLAYENGQVWQENTSNLWWAKSNPSDNWLPTYGTPSSPIPTRLWVGGGNNNASNPNDWSPNGAPRPGETLTVATAAPMHVAGNVLAGDTVGIALNQTATFDLTNGASLNLDVGEANANLNISGTVSVNAIVGYSSSNTQGGTIHFIGTNGFGPFASCTINSNIYGPATLNLGGVEGEGCGLTLGGDAGAGITINPNFRLANTTNH